MNISANLPLDGNALSARADATADGAIKEDQKLARSRRAAASSNQIDRSRKNIADTKREADENLQAAKDKTSGSLWGIGLGALLIVAAIAICVVCAPAAPVIAGILAAGVTSGGLAAKFGEMRGNRNAEDNEKKASEAKQSASQHELMAKTYENAAENMKDQIKASDADAQAVRDGIRKRREGQDKFTASI